MAKLNRRQLLISGFSAGITGAALAQTAEAQTTQKVPLPTKQPADSGAIEAIFGGPNNAPASPRPNATIPAGIETQPTIPYNREISSLLIRCSHLGIEQFEQGERDPQYNGSIRVLPSYRSDLDRYKQVSTFRVELDATTTLLPNLGDLGNRIVRRIVRPRQVFIGFALTSEVQNIIVFRGTANPKEWIANFQARQTDYVTAAGVKGQVHTGFLRLYNQISSQLRTVANQFASTVPCYVTGHSLGGAMATLATADLVQNNRSLAPQLQLYSYAAPRVGDLAFAQFFAAIAPNNFRVFNLSDLVPMVPPTNLGTQPYVHVGQEWGFLNYAGGDVSDTHTTTLYQAAINQRVEMNPLPTFPTSCRVA
jgi:predicted lipase